MSDLPFNRLSKEIKKAIYDLKWDSFRKIQDDSIKFILDNDNDLVISAPTASGKTEAAFIPALSKCIDNITSGVAILYVSPLKALINDQTDRVEHLCENINCKVTKWHGDASASKKKKLLDNPSGVLLITPESLEALLIRKPTYAKNAFQDLRYIIIDEAHSFIGAPRGDQLKSLINRIEKLSNTKTRKILLSATLGSIDNYKEWLNNSSCGFIKDNNDRGVKGSIRLYERSEKEDVFQNALANLCKSGKKLIFANSKGILEESCIKTKSALPNGPLVEVHHGSLSKSQREFVEESLKKENNISVFCTNTLELGIDIGDIDEVSLISPPFTCASFIQRIGRSGRTEGKSINFSFHMQKLLINEKSHLCDKIHDYFIQSIAVVELSIFDSWCEPGKSQTNSFSTLVHQVMSNVAQKRHLQMETVWNDICDGVFSDYATREDLNLILDNLVKLDMLKPDNRGGVELGVEGDYLTENFEFYSVFFTPEEWSVLNNGKSIGNIPLKNLFNVGDSMLFAGKRWIVEVVDFESKSIVVRAGKGGRPPKFSGGGGVIHRIVHQKMKEIYTGDESYPYLKNDSEQTLRESRDAYSRLLDDNSFLPIFEGSGVTAIASLILNKHDIEHDNLDFGLYLIGSQGPIALSKLKEYQSRESIILLLEGLPVEDLFFEKYDHLLPKKILVRSYVNTQLDIEGFIKFTKSLEVDVEEEH